MFHNFLCKYSNKVLPDNLDEVGLIIDEYKKIKSRYRFRFIKC